MNLWKAFPKSNPRTNIQGYVSHSAKLHLKAEITGNIFIYDSVCIGQSKISAESGNYICIGQGTVIKDSVTITSKEHKFEFDKSGLIKVKDIFIGNKVFISSEASIFGPAVLSDHVFIGYNTTIVNCRIGANCVIEDNVIIKNVAIPSDTCIPSKSIIDSPEKLQEVISDIQQEHSVVFAKAS